MRSKKILINTVYSIVSAVVIAFTALVTRRFFLTYFGVALLGYESLFSNVFSLLALSDLGVGTVITYALYQEVANHNEAEINRLMSLYKRFYQIVGAFIIVVGIVVYFFIPYIVKDDSYNWDYVHFVYIMQLISTLCTYFLAYRRILYTVDQKAYICVNIETVVSIISGLTKIISIVVLQNLFLYFAAGILNNLLTNLVISIKFRKDYSYACQKVSLSKEYLRKRNFFSDLGNNLMCRISETVYSSTDSILISMFIGIEQVGMYTNYMIIDSYITGIFIKLLKPIQAAIGNYVYQETQDDNKRMLEMLNLLSFFMAAFMACGYCVMFQQVIELWLGPQYYLSMLFVIFLSVNCYIRWNYHFIAMYRYTWGNFEADRNFYIGAAVFNIIVSIALQFFIGIAGIMLGTIVGQLFYWIGRSRVVYQNILKTRISYYVKQQIFRGAIFLLELIVCLFITSRLPMDWEFFFIRALICLMIPNTCNLLFFRKTEQYAQLVQYFKGTLIPLITKKNQKGDQI